jgi:hypothetical protein
MGCLNFDIYSKEKKMDKVTFNFSLADYLYFTY